MLKDEDQRSIGERQDSQLSRGGLDIDDERMEVCGMWPEAQQSQD